MKGHVRLLYLPTTYQRQVNLRLRPNRTNPIQLPVQPERFHRAVCRFIGCTTNPRATRSTCVVGGLFHVNDVIQLDAVACPRRERQSGVSVRSATSTLMRCEKT
jgi:hypothetical protein